MAITFQVSASLSDAHNYNGSYSNSAAYCGFGDYDDVTCTAYVRFQLSNIYKNSTISNAKLQLYAYQNDTGDFSSQISIQDVDSASDFTLEPTTDWWATAVTYAISDWTADTWYDTPDISTLIQHVIDRANWAAGNHVALRLVEGNADKDERRLFDSYDGSVSTCAKLVFDVTRNITVSDTGTGTDKISLIIPFSDTITDLSDLTVYYFRAKIQDSDGNWYYGEEKQFTTEEKPYTPKTVTDANSITTEDVSIEVSASVSDANSITTETISIDKTLTLADSGTSVEVVNIIAEVSTADSGISTDVISIDVALIVSDSGIGIEAIRISKTLTLTDSTQGIDIISIVGEIPVSDSSVGTEIIDVATQLLVFDSSSWSLREFW